LLTLAAKLFEDPAIDRSVYFPNIQSAEEAVGIFESKTLSSSKLFDLLQLTIRKKIDIDYVESFIDERIDTYLKIHCNYLAAKLSVRPDSDDEQGKKVKNCLMTEVNTRKDLDDLVNKTFIEYYSEHSYALFVEFLSIIYECSEENAKLQLDSNIYKVIQEKFRYELDIIYNTIQQLKQHFAGAKPEEQTGDKLCQPKTLKGMGPDSVAVIKFTEEPDQGDKHGALEVPTAPAVLTKSVVPAKQRAPVIVENARLQDQSGLIKPAVDTQPLPKAVQPAKTEEKPLPKVVVERQSEQPKPAVAEIDNSNRVSQLVLKCGLAAAVILAGVTLYMKNRNSADKTRNPLQKVALKASKDAGVIVQNNDASVPVETQLADASIQADVAVQVNAVAQADAAVIPASKPDATVIVTIDAEAPKPVEDKTLTMPLTKTNLHEIASTEQGRERLRKIALNDAGTVILDAKHPLYNYFGLQYLYQSQDIPLGQALFLNNLKIVEKNGVWHFEDGKRAFYYTGNTLKLMKID